MQKDRTYVCIDLKSFYASVECRERGLDPMTTNLVVADPERSDCFLQALFGEKCKIFLENVASPNWRKLQGLGWQLFCQLHSHCRPYLVVIA